MTLLAAGDTGRAGTPWGCCGAARCARVTDRHARVAPNCVYFEVPVFRGDAIYMN